MKRADYYSILGVSRDSTEAEIKAAYRKLARKLHPDLHPGDKGAEAKFKEINEAYDVLGDGEKRSDYDLGGHVGFGGAAGHGGVGGPGGPGGFGGFDFKDFGANMGGVEDIFGNLFGARGGAGRGSGREGAAPRGPLRGEDIEYGLNIDFLHAVKGTEVRVKIKRGKALEKLTVKVPPGVADGSRVKVSGKGKPSVSGGSPGDLYIVTSVTPHPYFRQTKDDIYVDVPITISEAVLGAKVDVPTLDGFVTIKVPPATASGQKLRIKGKGAARKGGGVGDLYAVISIALPKKIGRKTKELMEEFDTINPYEPRRGLW